MERDVAAALACYPAWVAHARRLPAGDAVGFSGARLVRLRTPAGDLCLRGAAAGETRPHLAGRHRLMAAARQAGLDVVPALVGTPSGDTVAEHAGRFFEVMQWMPGRADFHARPAAARLVAAAETLARLHRAWEGAGSAAAPCPAVLRRLDAARRPIDPAPARGGELLERLRRQVALWRGRVPAMLPSAPTVRVQSVLRDVWHDHLLFEGDRLTGLVDYASVATDSVAVDLARMLGSLVEDDEGAWRTALAAYRAVSPLTAEEERLARSLDRAGVVVALANWLGWLSRGERDPAHPPVRARVERLLARVEGWPAAGAGA